ncbi:MAG: hypothetical protein V3W31_02050 [Thermodesulfobacteriota bacterium]
MTEIKKVRCPNCKEVNEVDVERELDKNSGFAIKSVLSSPELNRPERIVVKCTSCKREFKVVV